MTNEGEVVDTKFAAARSWWAGLHIVAAMMVAQEVFAVVEEEVGSILLDVEGIVVAVGEEGNGPEPVVGMLEEAHSVVELDIALIMHIL